MIELLMQKKLGRLTPMDAMSIDAVRKIVEGSTVTARLTQTRNLGHHRKYFALMQTVFEAQTLFPTLEQFLDAIKIAIGHCEERHTVDGEVYWHPKSISFSAMDQTAFTEFYDRAVDMILTKILPNTNREDLEQRVFEILGEPGPADLTRSA